MHACPILLGYLRSLRKHIDFDSPLNEFGLPQQEELEEMVRAQPVSHATSHLRGFYCIQQTLERLMLRWPATDAPLGPPEWGLSATGLSAVINWARESQDYLAGSALETAVMQRTLPLQETGGGQVHQQNADRVSRLCSYLVIEAMPLRRSLKSKGESLRKVGYYYARVLLDAGSSVNQVHREALELLQQVEERHGRKPQRRRTA